MPIFEYKCHACGCEFEKLIRSSTPAAIHCEKCGSPEVEKLISVFGFSSGGEFTSSSSSGSSCGSCSHSHCSTCK